MFSATNIAAVLACAAELPSTSETDTRLNNTTRAEVFAGLLRAYRLHTHGEGLFGSAGAVGKETIYDTSFSMCAGGSVPWCPFIFLFNTA